MQHLVSLNLLRPLDEAALLSVCQLTRLTTLELNLSDVDLQLRSPAVKALKALRRLQTLQLTGPSAGTISLAHVDLSPLTELQVLLLSGMRGSFAAASTAAKLCMLAVKRAADRPGRNVLQAMQKMMCLDSLVYVSSELGPELEPLQYLPNLTSLSCTQLPEHSLQNFPNGIVGLCRAIGRLSSLTDLQLNYCRYDLIHCCQTPPCCGIELEAWAWASACCMARAAATDS